MALDWVETQVKPKFMQRTPDGQLVSCTMYYDPVVDHNNPGGTTMGLGIAFYLLPYEQGAAREMYEAWVMEHDLRNPAVPATMTILGTSQLGKLGLILAQEFGDEEVACKLRTVLEVMVEGREFGDGEFGFFSHLSAPARGG